MDTVSIHLFGPTPIRLNGRHVCCGVSGSTPTLLRFLLVNANRAHRRDLLCERIWSRGEASRPRAALNSALWRLQKLIGDMPGLALQSDPDHVQLTLEADTPCDARDLIDQVQAIDDPLDLNAQSAVALEQALEPCTEAFLDGAEFEWALVERERLFNIQVRGLAFLVRWHGVQGHYEKALDFGRRLVGVDPFREAVISELMWLYVLNGQRAQALRLYETFKDMLAEELGVAPLPETCALYRHIRDEMNGPATTGTPARRPSALTSLNEVLAKIEKSRRDTYRVLHSLPHHQG